MSTTRSRNKGRARIIEESFYQNSTCFPSSSLFFNTSCCSSSSVLLEFSWNSCISSSARKVVNTLSRPQSKPTPNRTSCPHHAPSPFHSSHRDCRPCSARPFLSAENPRPKPHGSVLRFGNAAFLVPRLVAPPLPMNLQLEIDARYPRLDVVTSMVMARSTFFSPSSPLHDISASCVPRTPPPLLLLFAAVEVRFMVERFTFSPITPSHGISSLRAARVRTPRPRHPLKRRAACTWQRRRRSGRSALGPSRSGRYGGVHPSEDGGARAM
jgi:hypothetical protein